MPSDHFIVNACVGIEDGKNHSHVRQFQRAELPLQHQRLVLRSRSGSRYRRATPSTRTSWARPSPWPTRICPRRYRRTARFRLPAIWSYGGQAQVVTLGGQYQASDRVRLTGKFEYVYGHDLINNSATEVNTTNRAPAAPSLTTDLGSLLRGAKPHHPPHPGRRIGPSVPGWSSSDATSCTTSSIRSPATRAAPPRESWAASRRCSRNSAINRLPALGIATRSTANRACAPSTDNASRTGIPQSSQRCCSCRRVWKPRTSRSCVSPPTPRAWSRKTASCSKPSRLNRRSEAV